MVIWHSITLPDGSTIQSNEYKSQQFWMESGVEKNSDLTKLKGEDARRLMSLAAKLYPDQVSEVESQ